MATKLWEKSVTVDRDVERYTVGRDREMDMYLAPYDVLGSMAHITMLESIGLLEKSELAILLDELKKIYGDIRRGAFAIEDGVEDVHSQVELLLTRRLGDVGKKIHSGRSRNDQVLVDLKLFIRSEIEAVAQSVERLFHTLLRQSDRYKDVLMPGYTHLQRAQPITFAHQLLAYGMMLSRDMGRLSDAARRMNYSPLGACALAGTTHPIDREFTAAELGFDGVCLNSLDAVSDRDFCVELTSALALVMMHLSRLAEELILWTSWEFRFVELSDAYTTGSSIMPQKKNSDMAELVRGKTGRVYGDLITLLTMLKGLPLAYNKDMQEDKEAVFDAFDTVNACLGVFAPMIETMTVKKENMLAAAKGGFINATDLADWLAKRGVPFRTAYKLTGEIVAWCIENGKDLESMTLEEYKSFSDEFDESLYDDISLAACVAKRTSLGGASPASLAAQIEYLKQVTA